MSQQERTALLHGPYTLQVDYGSSLGEALDAGRYNWVNRLATPSNFPAPAAGKATLSAVLVRFSPQANLDYVLSQAAGMRPATLWELLAFGQAYPEVQRKLPVMALGSYTDLVVDTYEHISNGMGMAIVQVVPRSERLYPFLAGGLSVRYVGADWLGDEQGYSMYYALFVKPQ